jgi:hypothetical protein
MRKIKKKIKLEYKNAPYQFNEISQKLNFVPSKKTNIFTFLKLSPVLAIIPAVILTVSFLNRPGITQTNSNLNTTSEVKEISLDSSNIVNDSGALNINLFTTNISSSPTFEIGLQFAKQTYDQNILGFSLFAGHQHYDELGKWINRSLIDEAYPLEDPYNIFGIQIILNNNVLLFNELTYFRYEGKYTLLQIENTTYYEIKYNFSDSLSFNLGDLSNGIYELKFQMVSVNSVEELSVEQTNTNILTYQTIGIKNENNTTYIARTILDF